MMRNLILVLILLCSSCIKIGSPPPPMNYYLLESMTTTPESYSSSHLNIHLQLIDFPTYLDRLQVITHNEKNGINLKDCERWAEPVQDNLIRVLRENLAQIITGSSISTGPWEPSTKDAIKTELIFNHFSGQLGEHSRIDVRWEIDKGFGQAKQGHFTEQKPIGDTYTDLIIGLNNGIKNLSLELAKSISAE